MIIMTKININNEKIRFYGRNIEENGAVKFIWPFSGFAFRGNFSGKIAAEYLIESESDCMLSISVDGVITELRVAKGEGSFVLAEVSEGEHEIIVRKSTEASISLITIKTLEFCGELGEIPEEKKLKIEIIGDSITCGVGAFPDSRPWEPFESVMHCDVMYAFPSMVAKALDADVNVVAVAGWGITRGSLDTEHRIPDIYDYTNGFYDREIKWDFRRFVPDIAVIALGANDGGEAMGEGTFLEGAYNFMCRVREKYPEAEILWVANMVQPGPHKELEAAVARMEGKPIRILDLQYDSSGQINHPSFEAQKGYAEKITEALKRF